MSERLLVKTNSLRTSYLSVAGHDAKLPMKDSFCLVSEKRRNKDMQY